MAETVEKLKNMIFITCKELILLIRLFKKRPKMDIFDSLAREFEASAILLHLGLLLRQVLPEPIPPREKDASNQVLLD